MIDDDQYWDQYPQTLTATEVSKILHVSNATVFSRLKSGGIPAHYIGRSWIVFRSELRAWLESTSNQKQDEHQPAVDILADYPDEMIYQDLIMLFGKTKQTIYHWLHTGEIPAYRAAGRWVIHKQQLRKKLEQTSNKSQPHS